MAKARYKEQATTVLLATNGEKTEVEYLEKLKDRIHGIVSSAGDKLYSVTVKFIEGDPQKIVRKLTNPLGDAGEFDHVWIVVDKDTFPLDEFLNKCLEEDSRRNSENNRFFRAVVSNPCFETWLVAHYTRVNNYQNQHQAQAHYANVAGLAVGEKNLPHDFPFEEFATACNRTSLQGVLALEVNAEGSSPNSAMPSIIEEYNLANSQEETTLNRSLNVGITTFPGENTFAVTPLEQPEYSAMNGALWLGSMRQGQKILAITLNIFFVTSVEMDSAEDFLDPDCWVSLDGYGWIFSENYQMDVPQLIADCAENQGKRIASFQLINNSRDTAESIYLDGVQGIKLPIVDSGGSSNTGPSNSFLISGEVLFADGSSYLFEEGNLESA